MSARQVGAFRAIRAFCYRCGAEDAMPGCACGVGWHWGKPVPGYVAKLPADWHAHTLVKGKK